jgi:hypothetical protein
LEDKLITIQYQLVGIILILIFISYFGCLWLIKIKGKVPTFRTLPAIEALEECVGRATEMGRPVLITPGMGDLHTTGVTTLLAGFTILRKVAEECAKRNTELVVGIVAAPHIPIVTGLVEEAYLVSGSPEAYKPENLIFLGGTQNAMIAGICGLLESRRPAAFIAAGGFAADLVALGGAARAVGALSVCGTTNTYQYPYAVVNFDYWLIGEDLLAASAAITKEPEQVASIWGGDIIRFILVGIIILGTGLTWIGYDLFVKYFKP